MRIDAGNSDKSIAVCTKNNNLFFGSSKLTFSLSWKIAGECLGFELWIIPSSGNPRSTILPRTLADNLRDIEFITRFSKQISETISTVFGEDYCPEWFSKGDLKSLLKIFKKFKFQKKLVDKKKIYTLSVDLKKFFDSFKIGSNKEIFGVEIVSKSMEKSIDYIIGTSVLTYIDSFGISLYPSLDMKKA